MAQGRSKENRTWRSVGDARRLAIILTLFFIGGSGLLKSTALGQDREKKVFAHHMASLNVGRGAMAWHARNPEMGDPATSTGGDYRTLALAPYDLYDLTVEESADLQIRRAMRIGIDGFAVNAWAGGEEAKEFLNALFKVAEENDYPFEISICPDANTVDQPNGLTQAWADAISYLLDRHGDSPKLARRDGKPIIFGYQSAFIWVKYLERMYNHDRELVDIARTTPEGWALVGEAYEELAAMVGQPLYFQFDMGAFYHGLETQWEPENGFYRAAEVIAQEMPALYEFLPSQHTRGYGEAAALGGAEWGQPIYLSYDNNRSNTTFGGPGTDQMRQQWAEAREFDATLLQVATWNDYHENTNLSPGTNTNYAYYDLTAYYIEWWKTGKEPTPDKDRLYIFSRKYPNEAYVYPFQRISGSEGAIEVLTILPEPARIRVPGHGEYDAPAGLHYEQFPVTAGPVSAEIIRNGVVEMALEAPEPVSDRPFRQDNGVTGYSSECESHWRADFGDEPVFLYSEYGDIDGDGLPNWWEMYWFGHFGDFSTATGAEPGEDANGDGYTNREAYLLQRSPVAPPGTQEDQPKPENRAPFTGAPLPIPGLVEAEDFDFGGLGIAYRDVTSSNEGGEYRPNDQVGIERTSDTDGNYNVGWMETGEWLEYTVDVEAAGTYTLHLRVASAGNSGAARFFVGGKDISGSVKIPDTGGWQMWQTVSVADVLLQPGEQTLRVAVDGGGFNLNFLEFIAGEIMDLPIVEITSPTATAVFTTGEMVEFSVDANSSNGSIAQVEFFSNGEKLSEVFGEPYRFSTSELKAGTHSLTATVTDSVGLSASSDPVQIEVKQGRAPFAGVAARFPGRIRAKDFDLGGAGVAYQDATPENEGGGYRPDEQVDLEATFDIEGGYNVGWTNAGEWMLYTVDVEKAGLYDLQIRVASASNGGALKLSFDDAGPVSIDVPHTGGWQKWETVTVAEVSLEAGVQTMRVECGTGDFNINYIEAQAVLKDVPEVSYASWKELHFTVEEIADLSVSGDAADPNGNGVPNLMEYALNRGPYDALRDGLPQPGAITIDGEEYLTLTYTRPAGVQDVTYVAEVSSDLSKWESGDGIVLPVTVTPQGDSEVVMVRDSMPMKSFNSRVIRLRVEPSASTQ